MTTPKKNFKSSTYSIQPKYFRRLRQDLGIDITTLNVVESLFNHAGDDLRPFPSVTTIGRECGRSESAAWWHIEYLRAHGLLPTEHEKLGGGRLRSRYDLRPLLCWNEDIHAAQKDDEPLPRKLPIPFAKWREQERQRHKGGRRGRRATVPAVEPATAATMTPGARSSAEAASAEAPNDEARQRVVRAVEQMTTPYALQNVYEALLRREDTRDIAPAVLKRIVDTRLSPDIPVRLCGGIAYAVNICQYNMNESEFASLLRLYRGFSA